jgi:hypothetical protein
VDTALVFVIVAHLSFPARPIAAHFPRLVERTWNAARGERDFRIKLTPRLWKVHSPSSFGSSRKSRSPSGIQLENFAIGT